MQVLKNNLLSNFNAESRDLVRCEDRSEDEAIAKPQISVMPSAGRGNETAKR